MTNRRVLFSALVAALLIGGLLTGLVMGTHPLRLLCLPAALSVFGLLAGCVMVLQDRLNAAGTRKVLPASAAVSGSQLRILEEVAGERARQDAKWGPQEHAPCVWATILSEECGEVSQAALDQIFQGKSSAAMREESVQVAAVAVAIVEAIDRENELSFPGAT